MPPVRKVKPKESGKIAEIKNTDIKVISGQLDKKLKNQQKTKKKAVPQRGVVFIKHLPHGFFEEQIQKYFQQFGQVTRLRLSRSTKTGGSKGYAFVEFEYPEVAQVAAETMNNYLMFKKVVKASYIPPEQQRFNYFKSSLRKVKNKAGKEIYVSSKTAAVQKKVIQQNNWSEGAYQKRTLANSKKIKKLNSKYDHLGIDFSQFVVAPQKIASNANAEIVGVVEGANSSQREVTGKKKSKKNLELEDLLGNTINDDSEDEDYIALTESEDEDVTSDEESYGFIKGNDYVSNDSAEDEANESATCGKSKISAKKSKAVLGKSLKSSTDRFDQLIKRKPLTGGIKKSKKKSNAKLNIPKVKAAIQMKDVKEMAKPLKTFKTKPNKNAKAPK